MKEKIKNEYAVKNGFDDWDDLLCNALPDFGRFAINEVMDIFVNQEVERRIKERMLSDEEISHEATDRYKDKVTGYRRSDLWTAFKKGAKWYRSRLTTLGDSQKTEGGGE